MNGAPLRVLVVDDNVDGADMVGQVLLLDGHEVLLAYGPAEGLDAARRFRPDVALLDIGMPGMNGFELARAIRGEADLTGIRLVALTGWVTEYDRARAMEAGFDAYLAKPAGIDELRSRILGVC